MSKSGYEASALMPSTSSYTTVLLAGCVLGGVSQASTGCRKGEDTREARPALRVTVNTVLTCTVASKGLAHAFSRTQLARRSVPSALGSLADEGGFLQMDDDPATAPPLNHPPRRRVPRPPTASSSSQVSLAHPVYLRLCAVDAGHTIARVRPQRSPFCAHQGLSRDVQGSVFHLPGRGTDTRPTVRLMWCRTRSRHRPSTYAAVARVVPTLEGQAFGDSVPGSRHRRAQPRAARLGDRWGWEKVTMVVYRAGNRGGVFRIRDKLRSALPRAYGSLFDRTLSAVRARCGQGEHVCATNTSTARSRPLPPMFYRK